MSVTRILDHDPITNATSYFHDDGDGNFTIYDELDATTLFEQNLAMRNTTKVRDRWGPGKQVAEIPLGVYYDLKAQGILDDQQAFLAWLQKSENMPFRTANYGRLI